MKIEKGVMIMKNGLAWGITYKDGHSTSYGWMKPEDAPIHDPKYFKKPTDATYANSPYTKELESATILNVERHITVKITDEFNKVVSGT